MGHTALITGGTGGLGHEVTTAFLDAGWRVVVPGTTEATLARLPEHDNLRTVRADLFEAADAEHVAKLAASAADAPLSAVVNLVGGFAMGGRVHETDVAEFERQLRLNLRPTYLTSQAALPHLIANGGGSITCVSSRAALRPFSGAAGYITGKAAVLSLVDAMAAEYKRDNVRVNAVVPSIIDTQDNRANQPDADRGKWVSPADIARVLLFLSSPDSGVVSGAHVPVYGTG
ncbi:SDR family NAD(P)-dependent oxidoreductase [Haloechinothrix salitolerans]|uniref:SDR family NAD(P)-dependent oxidoreductase n=1 Tax=Haloechinothrix salitolerans TaxID=926830 RepID=A0ABW2C310_9PSEU